MYYYGYNNSYGYGSNNPCCGYVGGYPAGPGVGPGVGPGGGFGLAAAIILVLFILLVIVIGARYVDQRYDRCN